jgi:diketogulonate reductase-like aldo/keto reductase
MMTKEDEVASAIPNALEIGYRHIDTAWIYGNEHLIGDALESAKKDYPREQLFITSKVFQTNVGSYDDILQSFNESTERLKTDYLDLLLIHWPSADVGKNHESVKEREKLREIRNAAWFAMEKLYNDKRVKAIGVSNFMLKHLEPLQYSIAPHANQIEYHPLIWKEYADLEKYCKEKNILIECYSPLAHGKLLEDKYKIDDELLLQWCAYAHGPKVVLPKSSNKERLQKNFNAIMNPTKTITDEDVKRYDDLFDGTRTCGEPNDIE